MISDEPDEDADALDDDARLDLFLGDTASTPDTASVPVAIETWPRPLVHGLELGLDGETLAWFKSTHENWRRQMRIVLRAWMLTHTAARPDAEG